MIYRAPHAIVLSLLLFAAACICPASAQLPSAELHTIFPAIAAAGTTIDIDLTGTNLDELKSLQFSDPRIQARPIMLPSDDFYPAPRQNGKRFKVTIPADLKPGIYEVRTVGYFGLSTSRPFVVAPAKTKIIVESGDHSTPEKAIQISIEQTATGHTDADLVDYYKFAAKKGQRLLIHCQAERLDSRMDGLLVLYDKTGRPIVKNQNHFGRDPMLDFTAKKDGEYFLGVFDALYRGGGQYHYQISLSVKPHIDFIFPPAGAPGTKGKFTLYGRNLPGGSLDANQNLNGTPLESLKVEIQIPAKTENPTAVFHPGKPLAGLLPGFDYHFKNSNTIRIGFAESPVIHEDSKSSVQTVSPPVEIAGRFDAKMDDDRYRFTAKKGVAYWLEVISNRMGTATDPYIIVEKITKPDKGEETYSKVADRDDPSPVPNDTLNIISRDSGLLFTADQDGDYQVTIVNQYKNGDLSRLYRLAIRPAKHDFQIVAVSERDYLEARQSYPAAALLRQGGNYAFRLIASRRDGFDGNITVTASGLPKGVSAQPAIISGKSTIGYLIITAAPDATEWAGSIRLSGQATIDKKLFKHEVRTASVIWGTADYNKDRLRSRLTTQIPLAVSINEKTPATLAATENKKWTVEIGKKLELAIKVTDPGNRKGNLTIKPIGLPGMKKPPSATVAEKKGDGKLTIDFTSNGNFKPEPGTYQFFLRGTGVTKYENNPNAAKRAEENKKRLEKLTTDLTAASAKASAAKAQAQKAFDLASKNATAANETAKVEMTKKVTAAKAELDKTTKAATDASAKASAAKAQAQKAFNLASKNATTASETAKVEMTKKVTAAKAELDKTTKAATDASAKATATTKEKDKAVNAAKAATAKAKVKDVKFAVYSPPITVEIKEKPKLPAKK